MKYQYDRSCRFKINEDVWEGYLVTEDELKELDSKISDDPLFEGDEEVPAMVLPSDKCLFIVEGNVNKSIIGHELFHIFNEYFHIESADVTVEQYEEVIAHFIEHRFDIFNKKRTMIYNKFRKLEGKKK